jgi:hypothetical protein
VDDCGLGPKVLAGARLIAEYSGRSKYTAFRGHDGKLEASAKAIYNGLEITLTVTNQDGNKDKVIAENVIIEIEPDGLDPKFVTSADGMEASRPFYSRCQWGAVRCVSQALWRPCSNGKEVVS